MKRRTSRDTHQPVMAGLSKFTHTAFCINQTKDDGIIIYGRNGYGTLPTEHTVLFHLCFLGMFDYWILSFLRIIFFHVLSFHTSVSNSRTHFWQENGSEPVICLSKFLLWARFKFGMYSLLYGILLSPRRGHHTVSHFIVGKGDSVEVSVCIDCSHMQKCRLQYNTIFFI